MNNMYYARKLRYYNAIKLNTISRRFQLTSDQLLKVYEGFISKYPVVSIEDAFDQDDWPAWSKMCAAVSIQLVGLVSPITIVSWSMLWHLYSGALS